MTPRVYTPESKPGRTSLAHVCRGVIILENAPHVAGGWGTTQLELHIGGQTRMKQGFSMPCLMVYDSPTPQIPLITKN